MGNFDLSKVKRLIELIRPLTEDKFWIMQYLRLQSMYAYFQYAVVQVNIQEENLKLMENGEHNNFPTHEAYAESDLRIYSSALAAYAHMRTCLHFSYELAESVENDKHLSKFRYLKSAWAENLIAARNILQAHPYQEKEFAWKRSMRCSDGRIEFPIRNMKDLSKSSSLIIQPRKDVELLRQYLEKLAELITPKV